LKSFYAAGRAAAGYFFLFGQKNVTKKKAAPEPPKAPALLAPAGREPNSPSAKRRARLRHRLATPPAEAPMLGGGYVSQRQQQHRLAKSGI
jgi:hypothetical protein